MISVTFSGLHALKKLLNLKKAGIKTPILILGRVFPFDVEKAVKYDIRIPIFSYDDAVTLSNEAVKQNKKYALSFFVLIRE